MRVKKNPNSQKFYLKNIFHIFIKAKLDDD